LKFSTPFPWVACVTVSVLCWNAERRMLFKQGTLTNDILDRPVQGLLILYEDAVALQQHNCTSWCINLRERTSAESAIALKVTLAITVATSMGFMLVWIDPRGYI